MQEHIGDPIACPRFYGNCAFKERIMITEVKCFSENLELREYHSKIFTFDVFIYFVKSNLER